MLRLEGNGVNSELDLRETCANRALGVVNGGHKLVDRVDYAGVVREVLELRNLRVSSELQGDGG